VVVVAVILFFEIFTFKSFKPRVIGIIVFFCFCFLGYFLIKTVNSEIKERMKNERLERELEKSNKSINALSKIKTEFLKVVGHQLRTPVSIIRGISSMLVEGSIKDNQKEHFIKELYSSSERLTSILDDILVTQGLIGGSEFIKSSSCQIEKIIKNQINSLVAFAETKKIKIKFKKPKKLLPIIFVDPDMIGKAIWKLIENAILYTPLPGPNRKEIEEVMVKVHLKKKRERKFIEISVKDNGIGLGKEDKKNVFKVFYRGEKATALYPNASGLGLFIVKNFIEIHDGRIVAKSEGRGKGSEFIITLPVVS
jgi:signal transduction histidine kinase